MLNIITKVPKIAGFVCFIHCITLPFLITILPLIGFSFVINGWVDLCILITAVIGTSASLCWGFPKHKKIWPFLLFCGSLVWFWYAHQINKPLQHVMFIVLAMMYFSGANWLNNRYCKLCLNCQSQTKFHYKH